jgi:hypothetical protein
VPIVPVGTNRQAMLDALSSIRPKPDGNTGMYDSILAAYQHLKAGWTDGMVNTLIVLTDGENDDPNGLNALGRT